MNCRQVHEKIEGYYEGELPLEEEMGIDIHLVQCPECERALGGIDSLVSEVRDSLDARANVSEFERVREGMKKLEHTAFENEKSRGLFSKKNLILQLLLLLVTIPTFWVVGNSAVETYNASGTFVDSVLRRHEVSVENKETPESLVHESAIPTGLSSAENK